METLLITGLILGITSNLHCIGMCGPIAMAIPVNRKSNWTVLSGILQYNFGRIFTYALLGSLVGSIGITVQTFGFLQWLSIISGVFLILFAWRKWISAKIDAKLPHIGIQTFVSKGLGTVIASNSPFKIMLLGVLNGLLPCGMVYVALFGAIAMQNVTLGIGYMLLFGLGTIPMMVAVIYASGLISFSFRGTIQKAIPLVAVIIGMLFIVRGLGLDIPYLSPSNMSLFVQPEANCH